MAITKLMEGLPNQSMSQADFDQATGKYMGDLPAWGGEANALAADVNAKQVAAAASAVTASNKAGEASDSAAAALSSKNAAGVSAGLAHDSELAAAASAAAAATAAAGVTASSTTSLAVGNGTQVFTVPAGKQFLTGVPMVSASAGAPANRMFGTVASYTGTTLTLTITQSEGSGTFADWSISPSGAKGGTGGTAGGQLTGALDELKGAAPTSSATPNPWSAGGNYVPITQTAAITGFTNAPQPGAKRTLKAESSFTITTSANLIVHGGSTTINIGDELDVVADTVSVFRVTVRRNDGSVPVSFHNVVVLTSSQVVTAKYTGPHKLTLVAASGSGGFSGDQTGARGVAASGGSSGAVVTKTWYATVGDSYTLTLGAPGAGISTTVIPSAFVVLPGNDAGASTFIGVGLNLSAGGGKKGNATAATSGNAVAAGAVGGTASGGDTNVTGSASGTATAAATGARGAAATGGGVAPYKGFAVPSGNATASAGFAAASGGAGVGGKSGDALATSNIAATSGGGYVGASPDATNLINTTGGAGLPTASVLTPIVVPLDLSAAGAAAIGGAGTTNPGSRGAGSGGIAATGSFAVGSGSSGLLGGTGGAANCNASTPVAQSGSVLYGGGAGEVT